uniref:Endonuclease/exonuclease/phosphatase domain-containing protein n=1 Tax=Micrurus corallinus TaxID=54390 RepID=A0A2D4EWV0_MICCO
MLLVIIYAPNNNQNKFYKDLHEKIVEMGQDNICIVGDLNAVVDIRKDYFSSVKNKKKRKILPRSFFKMTHELNFIDQWRRINLGKKEFTFYSNPHKSWSRLEMAWMNAKLGNQLDTIEIMTNVWADDNPLK